MLTDLYQLTMLEGYFRCGIIESPSVFDLFYRRNPFDGGYSVFAGLPQMVDYLTSLRFEDEDLRYLRSLSLFSQEFLDFLKGLRFTGDVYAFPEGSIIFPEEPLVRIEAPLGQAQLVETAILNIINFQTLIATKAARICHAAGDRPVIEFGLRRAHGENGGLGASRASYIGGCIATSNVLAGKCFGIPVKGTHAHSWIMAFDDEYTAFKKYSEIYPDTSILLVDTYDSIKSGIPNAIKVALELQESGHRMAGIRLDSGDPVVLSRKARRMLNDAGLDYVKILLSNDLDEYRIEKLLGKGAPVDIFGVGTRLATGHGEAAFPGVYKMSALEKNGTSIPRLKLSDETLKGNLPGRKNILRYSDPDGMAMCDVICIEDSHQAVSACDETGTHYPLPQGWEGKKQLLPVIRNGMPGPVERNLTAIQESFRRNVAALADKYTRLKGPDEYPVILCRELYDLKREMVGRIRGNQ